MASNKPDKPRWWPALEQLSVCVCVSVCVGSRCTIFFNFWEKHRFGDFSLSDMMILPGLMLQVCEDLSLSVSSHQWHKIFTNARSYGMSGVTWDVMSLSAKSGLAASSQFHHAPSGFPDKTRVPRFFVLFDGHFCRSIMVYLHFQVTPILFWLGNLHPITITPYEIPIKVGVGHNHPPRSRMIQASSQSCKSSRPASREGWLASKRCWGWEKEEKCQVWFGARWGLNLKCWIPNKHRFQY